MRKVLLALLAGLLPAVSSEGEQRFTFALPEMEGSISLGVFDAAGKLVRTLCVGAAETDFTVGLNGLIGKWDGKDDAGRPLPAGKYHIRGYLVGDALKAEGLAYHFNDWIADENSPRITRIEDFRKLPGGFIVLAEVSDAKKLLVFRFDQLQGFLWTNFLDAIAPAGPPAAAELAAATGLSVPITKRMLAVTGQHVTVLSAGSLHLLRLDDGTAIATRSGSFPHAACMDASDSTLFVGAGESLARIPLPGLEPTGEEKTPGAFGALTVSGERKLGASSSGAEVWESTGADWKRLPLATIVSSISFGLKETFWLTARDPEDGKAFTGQFDKEGEFLRAYRDEFSPLKVCASTTIEEIAVLETSGPAQRLRVLSALEANPDSPGDWAIIFEKTIQPCRRFGIVEAKLVADAGTAPQTRQVNLTLATGGLTSTSQTLPVRVTFDHAGLWLETRSGLRLAFLASQPNVRRVALLPGPGKDFLTVYAGDDAVVAEYGVRSLGNIVEIDVGEVELP